MLRDTVKGVVPMFVFRLELTLIQSIYYGISDEDYFPARKAGS